MKFSDLPAIDVKLKNGLEHFYTSESTTGIELNDFWIWAYSDLVSNTARGVLAEFIIAMALNINNGSRKEWDLCDLYTESGLMIEVKSAAYIQSWQQDKYSSISFGIGKKRGWDAGTNEYSKDVKRNSDIYVFSLLAHKDQDSLDPMNLDQWRFFIAKTRDIDQHFSDQQSLSLASLKKMNHIECSYETLARSIRLVEIELSSI